jgi:hypothetical protein
MCSGPVPQQPPTIYTLFIGTVNLDAGRSVIWSIGAIAASDYPAAADWRLITRKLKVKGKPQVYVIRNSFRHSGQNG